MQPRDAYDAECYFERRRVRAELAEHRDTVDEFDRAAKSASYRPQADRFRDIVLELMKRKQLLDRRCVRKPDDS